MRAPALYLVGRFPNLHVVSTYRSIDKQAQLYRTWLAKRRQGYTDLQVCHQFGICTPAPPGRSYHNYGRAFDLNGPAADLVAASKLWKLLGGRWYPADPIHFEA